MPSDHDDELDLAAYAPSGDDGDSDVDLLMFADDGGRSGSLTADSLLIRHTFLRRRPDAIYHEQTASRGRLWRATLPVAGENALALAVGWTEAALASGVFRDAAHLAAAAAGWQLLFLATTAANVVSIGATGLVSRRSGAGHAAKANAAIGQAILLAAAAGVVLALVAWPLIPWVAAAVGLSAEGQILTTEYLRTAALGVPGMLVLHASAACLRAGGQTWSAARFTALAWLTQLAVAVTFTLAVPLGWRVLPAAAVVGQTLGAVAAVASLARGTGAFQLPNGWYRPDWRRLRQILAFGVPGGSIWLVVHAAAAGHLVVVGRLGDAALATYGVALRIESLGWLVGRSFAASSAGLVGQAVGAGRGDLARHYGWLALEASALVMLVLGLALNLAGPGLVPAFAGGRGAVTSDVLAVLPAVAVGLPFLAAALVLNGAMVAGASRARWPLVTAVVAAIVGRLGVAVALTAGGWGAAGIWWPVLAEYAIRGTAAVWQFAAADWDRRS